MKTTIAAFFIGFAFLIFIFGSGCTSPAGKEVNPDTIQTMNTSNVISSKTSIAELRRIILTNSDPDIREDGVITLTRRSFDRQTSDETMAFLKENIAREDDEDVKGTMLASIGLLRSQYPLPKQGGMSVSVDGTIRRNANISVIVNLQARTSQERVRVGIPYINKSIELISHPVVMVDLAAGQPKRIRFDMVIHENGKFKIPLLYVIPFDRYDYEKVEKSILVIVNENDGSYSLEDE